MEINGRQAAVFACGIALGAAVAAWFVMTDDTGGSQPATASAAQPAPASAVAVAESTRCEFEPVIKADGSDDGTSRIPADLSGRTAAGVPPLLVTGKENAAAGRPRDAEVAFLTACRIGRELGPPGAGVYADAKYQLGRHYANVARSAPEAATPELRRRAQSLYTDALQALRAQHGESHEKTRFAAQGLAALQAMGNAPAAAEAPKTVKAEPAPVPAAAPAPAPAVVRAPPEAAPVPPMAKVVPKAPSEARAPVERRAPAPLPELASAPEPRFVEPRIVQAPPIQPRAIEPQVALERPAARPRPEPQPPQEPAVVIEEPPGAATGSTGATQ